MNLAFILKAEIDHKACEEVGTDVTSLKEGDWVVVWGLQVQIRRIIGHKFYFWKNISSIGCSSLRDVNELLLGKGLIDEWHSAVAKKRNEFLKHKKALDSGPIYSLEL